MLKHREIIEKLTTDQKLRLIASLSALSSPEFEGTGIPFVRFSDLPSLNAKNRYAFPAFSALANSWNAELMGEVSGILTSAENSNGIDMAFTPDLRLKSHPYSHGMTEDPYLAERYADSVSASIVSSGVLPCLSECGLTEDDAYYADKEVNRRALRDYYLRPFSSYLSGENKAVSLSYSQLGGRYKNVNVENIPSYLKQSSPEGFTICSPADAVSQIRALAAGNILLDGDVKAIKAAHDNYLRIKDKISKDECGADTLDKACENGTAVSDELIDQATDRVIGFAHACCIASKSTGKTADKKATALKAAKESIVLLRNYGNILPLSNGTKVAVIGNLTSPDGQSCATAFAEAAKNSGKINVTGTCAGYEADDEINDGLIARACECAASADVVILFLGTDTEREKTMISQRRAVLPANQLALLDALAESGRSVIAVVDSGICVDMSFDVKTRATLLASVCGEYGGQALAAVLTGAVSPSGRLASTYYDYTDEIFSSAYEDKQSGKSKIGIFVGYRNYVTAQSEVRYPFGFGLSYSEFTYSDLSVDGNNVTFKVKNTGKRAASEVAQVYLGKEQSAVLCPAKQLAAFAKISLNAGESRKVTLAVDPLAVAINTNVGRVTEAGEYNIFIGSSSTDVKLSGKMTLNGKKLKPTTDNIADYIRPISNVLSEGYVFGEVKSVPKRGIGVIATGAILGIVGLLCVALSLVPDLVAILPSGISIILFFVSLGIVAASVLVLFIGICVRASVKSKTPVVHERKPDYVVAPKKQAYKSMFEDLFDDDFTEEEPTDEPEDEQTHTAYSPDIIGIGSVNCIAACERLDKFAAAGGVVLGRKNASKILAAFCASRLVIINGKNTPALTRLLKALSGFFGSEYYADEYVSSYTRPEQLLGYTDERGERIKTQVSAAIEAASHYVDNVHMATLNGVLPEDIGGFFMPYTKYVSFPTATDKPSINGISESGISPNLWFVFTLKEGSGISQMSPDIANIAAFIDLDISSCEPTGSIPQDEEFTYSRLLGFERTASELYYLSENECWKKVDRLEKYIRLNSALRLDNKSWSRMERFASAYLACGGEQAEALDCTVAAKLIIMAMIASASNPESDQKVDDLLDSVFGEDNIPECKKILSSDIKSSI
ncbi:MAG: glycoside hydrolase family 3 C-terminal domain-containing protein [Candidatus Coproplasma sp.]